MKISVKAYSRNLLLFFNITQLPFFVINHQCYGQSNVWGCLPFLKAKQTEKFRIRILLSVMYTVHCTVYITLNNIQYSKN